MKHLSSKIIYRDVNYLWMRVKMTKCWMSESRKFIKTLEKRRINLDNDFLKNIFEVKGIW